MVFLQVCELVLAGVCGLTAGMIRGAAPADVVCSVSRSRRPRRVITAATSTRIFPPKFLPGDLVAAPRVVDSSSRATATTMVNAANERMLGGGGVDGAIHRAAGPQLVQACRKVPEVKPGVRCPTGEARITPAYELPVSRVIHTVGPIYDIDRKPEVSLKNAYKNSLKLAKENGIQYIAFPAISCGVFRYPPKEASNIAISTAQQFAGDIKEVHFVLFLDELYDVWRETAQEMLTQFEK